MKKMKKMMALVIALVMTLALGTSVFAAQTVAPTTADPDNATITINNPASGETYSLYKLFDATVSSDNKIAYSGTVPPTLSDYFKNDSNNNALPKDAIADTKDAQGNILTTKMTDALKADLETWAKNTSSAKVAEAVSNGDKELVFTGLPYGYYVMITTHKSDAVGDAEAKAAITVCSTIPNATINDKNVNVPSAEKKADKDSKSYSVGETVTYTATFDAPNYMETEDTTDAEGTSEQVTSYTIKDTLPDFLRNVTITKVEIKQPGVATNVEITPTPVFNNKQFDVKWVTDATVPNATHKYTSAYKAGSQIIVTYTAVVTSNAVVDGAGNTNTVSIMPNVDRGNDNEEPWDDEDHWSDDETIYTYATALKKVDGTSAPLAGAKFSFTGLTLKAGDTAGVYTVISYDPNSTADGTEVEVASDGKLVIVGLDKAVTLTGKETKAPAGYNQLTGTFELTPILTGSSTTTTWGSTKIYYNAAGEVVDQQTTGGTETKTYSNVETIPETAIKNIVNNKGTELPSTGGIGTTIFYVIGAILVLGAGILLVTRRRMNAN